MRPGCSVSTPLGSERRNRGDLELCCQGAQSANRRLCTMANGHRTKAAVAWATNAGIEHLHRQVIEAIETLGRVAE